MAGPFLRMKVAFFLVVLLFSLSSVTECFVCSALVLSVLLAIPTRMNGAPEQYSFTSGAHFVMTLSTVYMKEMNEQCQEMLLNVRTNKWRALQTRSRVERRLSLGM